LARNIKKEVKKHKEISYTNKDFKSLRNELRNHALTHFSDNMIDFSDASLGGLILDLGAYVGDVLTYYMDHQFNENSIENAVERNNIERLIREAGVDIPGPSPSYAEISVSLIVPATLSDGEYSPSTLALPKIKKNSIFATSSGIEFTLLEDIDFAKKDDEGNLIAIKKVGRTDPSTGTPVNYEVFRTGVCSSSKIKTETFSISDTLVPFRTITLSESDVNEVVIVTDTNGDQYHEVNALTQDTVFKMLENSSYDRADVPYRLELLHAPKRFIKIRSVDTGNTTLRFGAGSEESFDEDVIPDPSEHAIRLFGDRTSFSTVAIDPNSFLETQTLGISPRNTTLTVTYRHGGGLSHNVSAGEITSVKSLSTSFNSATSAVVASSVRSSLVVINQKHASGGEDEPTIEELRNIALFNRNSQNRIVTREDLIARVYSMPSNFGRIFRVAVADNPRNPRGSQLYVISRNSKGRLALSTDTLKINLAKYLNKFRLVSDAVDILDASIINISLKYNVTVEKGYRQEIVINSINAKMTRYFDVKHFQINKPLIISELNNIILNTPGVISLLSLNINPRSGIYDNRTYSNLDYTVAQNFDRGILFPPLGGIFEMKYPNDDIEGRSV